MLTIPLIILAAIAALLPWWLLFRTLRAGHRMSRPVRVVRRGQIPLTRPGNPAMGTALMLLPLLVLGTWLVLIQPLWSTYLSRAWEYRTHGAAQANLVSAELMQTERPLGTARMGRGYVLYNLGEGDQPLIGSVAYYWRGSPVEPGPADPVETELAPGEAGLYVLTYRRGMPSDDLTIVGDAFERITRADQAALRRRPGVDIPLLLRSVQPHWQGYFGYLDTLGGGGRFLAGLPALPLLYISGLIIGGLPGS